MLISTGTGYDSQLTSASARITRKVYHKELGDSGFEIDSLSEVAKDLDYDRDASSTTLLVNMTSNSNSNRHLTSEDYALLTPEENNLWVKLTPNMKHVILKGRNSKNKPNNRFRNNKFNNPSYRTIKPPSCKSNHFTKANLYELLHELIVEIN